MSHHATTGIHQAFLKLRRAEFHVAELEKTIPDIKQKGYNPLTSQQHDDGSLTLRFDSSSINLPNIALIAGDCVQNLRASLDYAWNGFERAAGKTGRTYFPFHESRSGVENRLSGSSAVEKFPKLKDIVLGDIRPFNDSDGDGTLWRLTKLSNHDKHNLLNPVARIDWIESYEILIPGGAIIKVENASFSYIGCFGILPQGTIVQNIGRSKATVVFASGDIFGDEPVAATLKDLTRRVESALDYLKVIVAHQT